MAAAYSTAARAHDLRGHRVYSFVYIVLQAVRKKRLVHDRVGSLFLNATKEGQNGVC